MNDTNIKPCVTCGTDMKKKFEICPQCHSYQNQRKRALKKILEVFSGLSIVLGALTIIVSFYPQVKNALYYNENIDLVSINSTMSGTPGNIAFVNKGDGDVFISELVMSLSTHDLPFEIRLPIHELVKKNEMKAVRFDSKRAQSSVYSDTVGENELLAWVNNKSSEQVTKTIYKCFLLKPFDKLKGSYLLSKQLSGVKLQSTIHFYSLETKQTKTHRSETPIQGLIFRSISKKCSTNA